MAIERQAVQGLPQVQATSPSVMTFAPQQVGGVEAGVASTSGSRFIEDLINAASTQHMEVPRLRVKSEL